MELYDEAIKGLQDALLAFPAKELPLENISWEDAGDHNLILRSDMAYELGGGTLPALSGMAVTESKELVPKDQVILIGPDLPDIKKDTGYARISLVRAGEGSLGDGNELYNQVRKIEYVRYHVAPKGYMTRISASNGREPVRVGQEALAQGLDFSRVASCFLKKYHENKNIEAVRLIFISDQAFDYGKLAPYLKSFEGITAAIDHIFKNVVMDCGVCNLKPVCDEVEGLRELHFSQKA